MFKFVWSKRRLKIAFWILVVAVCVGSVFGFLNWASLDPWLKDREQVLKLVGYLVAPLFALLSYVSSQLDKIELREQQDELSRLRERAVVAEGKAKEARDAAAQQGERAEKLLDELKAITVGAEQLWKVRPARPFERYKEWWFEKPGAIVVTIGNLKGGVGKTTLAANFAAYLSEKRQKRVLIIDLDYQGSLSGLLLKPLNIDGGAKVNALFQPDADVADVLRARIQLVPTDPLISTRLSRAWLVPSDYEYGTLENRLLLRLLLNQSDEVD